MYTHIYIIHHNEDTVYLTQLEDQLNQIKSISYWSTKNLKAGEVITDQINVNFNKAVVVIALLSADYFNDDKYCLKYQSKALESGKILIPILLRPCLYTEYAEINNLQVLPKDTNGDTKALSRLNKNDTEEAWVDIVMTIKETTKTNPSTQKNNHNMPAENETFYNGYALLVGVGADLPVTVTDAECLEKILTNPQRAGYLKEHVWCLTEKKATRTNILDTFAKLIEQLEEDAYANKTVIVYYSGHGKIINEDTYCLCPNDFDWDTKANGISATEFVKQIDEIAALGVERILVILDCCHAGGIKDAPQMKSSNQRLQEKLENGTGRITIAACLDNQKSYILPNATNSLFTQVLIDALAGEGLTNTDTVVGVIDLMAYTSREVPKRQQRQTPIIPSATNLTNFAICARNIAKTTTDFADIQNTGTTKSIVRPDEKEPQTSPGILLHQIPNQMQINNQHLCIIRIAFDKKSVLKELEKNTPYIIKGVKISDSMEVNFIGNKYFLIEPLNSPRQPIFRDEMTEWQFKVTPLKLGSFPLEFKASILLSGGRVKEVILRETIMVKVEKVDTALILFKSEMLEFNSPPKPPTDFTAIENAYNQADYATVIELLDEHFGNTPTPQYSTLKQTIEHYLNQGQMPPPAALLGLKMLINRLRNQ